MSNLSQNQKIIIIIVTVLLLCCCCSLIAIWGLSANIESVFSEVISGLEQP
jgi:hypothetical protein